MTGYGSGRAFASLAEKFRSRTDFKALTAKNQPCLPTAGVRRQNPSACRFRSQSSSFTNETNKALPQLVVRQGFV